MFPALLFRAAAAALKLTLETWFEDCEALVLWAKIYYWECGSKFMRPALC